MRMKLAAGILLALSMTPAVALAQQAPAQAPAQPPVVLPLITNPNWRTMPIAEFPSRATQNNIEVGEAIISCELLATGRLTNCTVVSEDPPGYGFGESAIRASRRARITPAVVNGVPQVGRVVYPQHFLIRREG